MPKAMIVTVGGTPEPIIKSIFEYKPEFVSFLASQDTCGLVASIRAEVAKNMHNVNAEITLADNVNDLLHCHEKAEEAVERVVIKGYRKEDVIVDYTGGTKNMSVAIALASITHGFSFSYVGGKERTKQGMGIVVNGEEIIYPSINPWDFLAIEEKKKIALLFNQYQFKAAKNLVDELIEKGTKYKSLFKKIGFLIEGYQKWDLLRHREALDRFKRAKIEEILEIDDKPVRTFANATKPKLDFLEKIIRTGKNPSILFIRDIYANAERRFEEGKVDDAILRIYRLCEMIVQEQLLSKYEVDTSDVKEDKIPESLKEEFAKNYKSPYDNKIKIPLNAACTVLYKLRDELGERLKSKETEFRAIQSARNYSYLAHGFECSKEETYLKLKDFVLDLQVISVDDLPSFPKMETY